MFVPLVVAGAIVGRGVGDIVNPLDPTLYVLLGIAAFLGAGYRVPRSYVDHPFDLGQEIGGSIAALGPITGPIIAVQWGWLPALLWVILGTFFIGWVQDYGAMMMGVRREGETMGALSYKLISPRARRILMVFIYFYLLLIMGSFGNAVGKTLMTNPKIPLGLIIVVLMGVLAGQMTYKWKKDIILTTVVTVGISFVGIWLSTLPAVASFFTALSTYFASRSIAPSGKGCSSKKKKSTYFVSTFFQGMGSSSTSSGARSCFRGAMFCPGRDTRRHGSISFTPSPSPWRSSSSPWRTSRHSWTSSRRSRMVPPAWSSA